MRAILEHPEDDQARLVYADWLEDDGQDDRAELIRLQVEIGRHPFGVESWASMQGRGAELLYDRRPLGTSVFYHNEVEWIGDVVLAVMTDGRPNNKREFRWNWHRGFVAQVALDMYDFMKHCKAICEKWPVDEFRIRGTVPSERILPVGRFLWYSCDPLWFTTSDLCDTVVGLPHDSHSWLPRPLFDKLDYKRFGGRLEDHHYQGNAMVFGSETNAELALMQAALDYAREQAGLPPIIVPALPVGQ